MFGFDLEWLLRLANGIYIFSLVVAAISTFAIYQLSGKVTQEKDRQLTEFRLQSEKEIAHARSEAAQAAERAAEATKDAETARLEQERIKSRLAWRVIPQDRQRIIIEALSQSPGHVVIQYAAGDVEAMNLGINIAKMFEAAGWTGKTNGIIYPSTIVGAFRIPDTEFAATDLIRKAFDAAQIRYSTRRPTDDWKVPGAPVIYVGTKLPDEALSK
jgi:hypothetical protein